jgi:hypothetical protein
MSSNVELSKAEPITIAPKGEWGGRTRDVVKPGIPPNIGGGLTSI